MSWGLTARRAKKKNVISQPPIGELNEAMRPAVAAVGKVTRKRGRPKSTNGYDAQLNVRCRTELKIEFQVLCAQYGVEYSVMLKQCIDAYRFMEDE